MVRRLLRVSSSSLVIAVALVTPVLATTTATPASADTVIDGCTIVSNPTSTNFTDCPGADLSGVNLSSANLSYANLSNANLSDTDLTGATFFSVSSGVLTSGTDFAGAIMTGADLRGAALAFNVNFTNADLSNADLAAASIGTCFVAQGTPTLEGVACFNPTLTGATLAGANLDSARIDNLSGLNLAGADLTSVRGQGCFTFDVVVGDDSTQTTDCEGIDLDSANLTGANLSSADLSLTTLSSATLAGATSTGTSLIPFNQTVSATSGAGAAVTWPTPPSRPGATPGGCIPHSGSTFPLETSTVTCQVLDAANDVASGTFQVNVQPFTHVLLPANGASLTGAAVLDAAAPDTPGIKSVVFEVSGGTLRDQVVATATPTIFGWAAKWNTTSVPNGTYSLQSVATDANISTETSNPITIKVNNQPPTTGVVLPSGGASLSGATALVDALASSAVGIASVSFEVSGNGLSDQVIATGTPTLYGYLAQWNTTAVPNGSYSLQSVATDTISESTTSVPVSVAVDNASPSTAVLFPSPGATQSGTTALVDASASAHVTSVSYELTGGTLTNKVIATGTLTPYGWLAKWNTTTVSSGTYTLRSVASYTGGVSGTSSPITITISN